MIGLFRPSGGLLYHWRAWRRPALWREFRTSLTPWLESWKASSDQLLLIGPSGGYTLPNSWLQRFKTVVAYDVDPLAGRMFSRHHANTIADLAFRRQDLFWRKGRLSFETLGRALNQHPQAAVLFSNVLGQLPLEGRVDEEEWRDYLTGLRALLKGRSWASYHDLLTLEPIPFERHAQVLREFSVHRECKDSLKGLAKVQAIDHLMGGPWSEGLTPAYFGWSLSPTSLHIIEGLRA